MEARLRAALAISPPTLYALDERRLARRGRECETPHDLPVVPCLGDRVRSCDVRPVRRVRAEGCCPARAASSGSVSPPAPGSTTSIPALAYPPRRAGPSSTRLRAAAGLPGQAAARGVPPRAGGRRRPPDDLARPQDLHLHAAHAASASATGRPVRASAFARAINRMLAPGVNSPGVQLRRDIVGAADVLAGRTHGRVRRRRHGEHARRPVHAPGARLRCTARRRPFFCAVPPTLPADPEGVGAFPAAGPYYVAEYRPGERVVIRRNRFYGGTRPHHVDGFDVDLRAALAAGDARPRRTRRRRLGPHASPASTSTRRSALVGEVRDQPVAVLRQAGADAADARVQLVAAALPGQPEPAPGGQLRARPAGARQRIGGPLASVLTDQYLPPTCPASRTRTSIRSSSRISTRRESSRAGNLARREGRALHDRQPAAVGGRAARQAAARGDRARGRGAGRSRPHRDGGVLREARRPGRAVGHRARPLDAELRRPVRLSQPAPRQAVHRRHELRRASTRATTTRQMRQAARCRRARDRDRAYGGARRRGSRATPRRSPRSTSSTSRRSSRRASAASSCGPCST